MTSIITNTAAMSALATLRSISDAMETTQNRVSSGYRIETATDNAAYWSIATTMRSDNKALSAVKDALGLGAAKSDTAYTAMNASIKVVDEIKTKLVAASEPGVDKGKIQKEITELQNQLRSIAKSASFSGENWVYHDPNNVAGDKEVVGSFNRDKDGNVSLTTLKFDTNKSSLIAIDAAGDEDIAQQINSDNGSTQDPGVAWLSSLMAYQKDDGPGADGVLLGELVEHITPGLLGRAGGDGGRRSRPIRSRSGHPGSGRPGRSRCRGLGGRGFRRRGGFSRRRGRRGRGFGLHQRGRPGEQTRGNRHAHGGSEHTPRPAWPVPA